MSLEQVLMDHCIALNANTFAINNMLKTLTLKYPFNDINLLPGSVDIGEEVILARDEADQNTNFKPVVEKQLKKSAKVAPLEATVQNTDTPPATEVATSATTLPTEAVASQPSYQEAALLITEISTKKGMASAKEFLAGFGLKSLRDLPEGHDLTNIRDAALVCIAS